MAFGIFKQFDAIIYEQFKQNEPPVEGEDFCSGRKRPYLLNIELLL